MKMSTTLTIRLPQAQREALRRRAAALKKTESRLIRDLVERETAEETFAAMVERWAGVVGGGPPARRPRPMAKQLRERNWRK